MNPDHSYLEKKHIHKKPERGYLVCKIFHHSKIVHLRMDSDYFAGILLWPKTAAGTVNIILLREITSRRY
jgi:hypothetical protein